MLRNLARLIALISLAMAMITGVLDITRSIADSTLIITPLGIDWYNFSPKTLQLSQAVIQSYVHPFIWDPVIQTVLQAPSWAVFIAIWLLLSMVTKENRRTIRGHFQE